MLKLYEYNGLVYQWEEGKQPEGAVEVKRGTVEDKQAEPANKAAEPTNKAAKPRTRRTRKKAV